MGFFCKLMYRCSSWGTYDKFDFVSWRKRVQMGRGQFLDSTHPEEHKEPDKCGQSHKRCCHFSMIDTNVIFSRIKEKNYIIFMLYMEVLPYGYITHLPII